MVSQRVNDELTERAAQFGLILDDISLVSLSTLPANMLYRKAMSFVWLLTIKLSS